MDKLPPPKEVRDAGMEAATADYSIKFDNNQPPFDGKCRIFGGFRVLVQA